MLNNTTFFYVLFLQNLCSQWKYSIPLTHNHVFQILFKHGFDETLTIKTTESLIFKNYPVGMSLNSTLKYWILRNNLSMLLNSSWKLSSIKKESNIIFNRYYKFSPFTLTRSTRKIFKMFLTKFRTFLLFSWVQWNSRYRIQTQHTYVLRNYFLFRFLNIYYSKVFNF